MIADNFIDYYEILQVSPGCNAKTLEAAYRHLAKMYHPDHPSTADSEKFNEVISAYKVLRKPSGRTKYDQLYAELKGAHWLDQDAEPEAEIDAEEAATAAVVGAPIGATR